MTIWKKAISVATSAALLASLLATAVAPGAFAATVSAGTRVPYVASNSEVPADGASSIVLDFGVPNLDATSGTITVSTTNGRFTNQAATLLVIGTTQTIATLTPGGATDLGFLTLTAPSAAGTATVTVQITPALGGTAVTDSITTFTFTAASGTSVSTSFSSSSLVAFGTDTAKTTAPATPAGDSGVQVKTVVADSSNVPIVAGAAVTWAITGPAYFTTGSSYTQTVDATTGGIARSSMIKGTGVAGAATITTKVKHLGVTTDLTTVTLTFVGNVAKVVASNNSYVLDKEAAIAGVDNDALFAEVTDANGQMLAAGSGVTFAAGTYTPAGIIKVGTVAAWDPDYKGWNLDVECLALGTATVTLKATTGTTTVTSAEAVSFTCSNPITTAKPGTLVLTAGATAVAANSSVPILVTIKNADGQPVPDGFRVNAVTNGVGTVFSSTGNPYKNTSNGVAKFTYFAPANSGSGTVTVFATNTVPTTASITLLIGPTGAGVSVGQVESALGVTTTGPWSKSTKVAKVGEFITFKIAAGSANAGKTIGIFIQQKDANGVWSAPVRFSARVADSKGNAYFHWRGTKVAWFSLKGGLGDLRTNPVQARWVQ